MRFKSTVLLLVLNIALGSYLFYLNNSENAEDEFLSDSRLILNNEFSENLNRVEVSTTEEDPIWVLKKEMEWNVESPFRWKANPYAIERLMGLLKSLRWETRFPTESLEEAGRSLRDYGLETPTATLNLASSNSDQLTLKIGSPTEIGNRLYALSPQNDFIYVLDRNQIKGLLRDMSSFYDRRVFNINPDETRAIQIQDRSAGNVRVRLIKSGNSWKYSSPIETPADPVAVLNTLLDISSAEIDHFAGEVNENEFETPILSIVIEGFNHRETLLFSSAEGTEDNTYVLAKKEKYPTSFKLPRKLLEDLRVAQESLREKRLLSEVNTNWTAIEIRMDAQNTVLQKLENGSWQVVYTSKDGRLQTLPTEAKIIDNLISEISDLQAVQFVTDAPSEADLSRFGLINPQRQLILRKEGETEIELRIGDLDSEEMLLHAKTNLAPTISLVRPFILAEAPLNPLYYRDRTLFSIPEASEITSIDIIRLTDGLELISNKLKREDADVLQSKLKSWAKNPKVSNFLKDEFESPIILDSERSLEWTHEIAVNFVDTSGENPESSTLRLMLTQPAGGTTQFVGSETIALIGILPLEIISAIAPLFGSEIEFPELKSEPTP